MFEQSAAFSGTGVLYDVIIDILMGAFLLAVSYTWLTRQPSQLASKPPESLILAVHARYAGAGLVCVAQAQDYFKREGLSVTLQPHASDESALKAALAGQADLATAADMPIMFALTEGRPVSVVATISMAERGLGIIGRKDRGVVTMASLEGKRIGVTLGTSGHFVLDLMLLWHH